jgi:hypothetical protein
MFVRQLGTAASHHQRSTRRSRAPVIQRAAWRASQRWRAQRVVHDINGVVQCAGDPRERVVGQRASSHEIGCSMLFEKIG